MSLAHDLGMEVIAEGVETPRPAGSPPRPPLPSRARIPVFEAGSRGPGGTIPGQESPHHLPALLGGSWRKRAGRGSTRALTVRSGASPWLRVRAHSPWSRGGDSGQRAGSPGPAHPGNKWKSSVTSCCCDKMGPKGQQLSRRHHEWQRLCSGDRFRHRLGAQHRRRRDHRNRARPRR